MKALLTFIGFSLLNTALASPLTSNEELTFFPTSAAIVEKNLWKAPIHHWIYDFEEASISRKLGTKVIAETLEFAGLSDQDTTSKNFKERIKWFLVDNKGGKNISVQLSNIPLEESVPLNPSHNNGHANSDIYLPFTKALHPRDWVKIEASGLTPNTRKYYGEVQLIPTYGLSVISDIDDTIKISNVLDKKKLLKNIFVKNYQATKGMPELFQKLKAKGAYFHYVSASPWQLYPSLKAFMGKYYPKGTMSLRYFRLKDKSFFNFFRSSQHYKIKKISAIIKRYPKHRFILIGDSGEHDPEVYASIYRQFPRNVQAIWIRYVGGSHMSKQRLATDFKGVPRNIWHVFSPSKTSRIQ